MRALMRATLSWSFLLSALACFPNPTPPGGKGGGAHDSAHEDDSADGNNDSDGEDDTDTFDDAFTGYQAKEMAAQTFEMGCTLAQQPYCTDSTSNEKPAHDVTLTRSFWIDNIEVTRTEYGRLMGTESDSNYPVVNVSWSQAAAYANARSIEQGLGSCYTCSGTDLGTDCTLTAPSPYACLGWRLPTEAEWEAAARCGTDLLYAGSDELDLVGWYGGNSAEIQPVGGKLPNECGLYDMSGNVWEWVGDWYSDYVEGPVSDPSGPTEGSVWTMRGGASNQQAVYARVSFRYEIADVSGGTIGFRLVRTVQ